MNFNYQQTQIIKLLKGYSPLSLVEISNRLNLNKSSVLYQLDALLKEKVIEKNEISPKKIKYNLAGKERIEEYINFQTFKLSNLLTNKEVEGLQAYIDLLDLVAKGKGDIWGFANLERKLIPELESTIEDYRDRIAASGRKDIFTITDTPENISLLKDHFRKPEWKKCFIGRIIPKSEMDVNCDIYIWDNIAGICSFEGNRFIVNIYNDLATVDLLRALLIRLFDSAKSEEEYRSKFQNTNSKS